jgi:hypothetical protein
LKKKEKLISPMLGPAKGINADKAAVTAGLQQTVNSAALISAVNPEERKVLLESLFSKKDFLSILNYLKMAKKYDELGLLELKMINRLISEIESLEPAKDLIEFFLKNYSAAWEPFPGTQSIIEVLEQRIKEKNCPVASLLIQLPKPDFASFHEGHLEEELDKNSFN